MWNLFVLPYCSVYVSNPFPCIFLLPKLAELLWLVELEALLLMVTIYLLRDFALGSEEEVSSQNKSILIETVCSSVIEVEVKQSGLLTHLAWVTGNYFYVRHLSCF